MSCPECTYPNDRGFHFCQRCGYKRGIGDRATPPSLKAAIDWDDIRARREILWRRSVSTPYAKQKTSLEGELSAFLSRSSPPRDVTSATPDDVVNFLIWKDHFGKTVVHNDSCSCFGDKKNSSCLCPKRLAFGTVDSMIGKLRAIFSRWGRMLDDAALPGYGNPAASLQVKNYLRAVREEQLKSQTLPTQAEPLFLRDLVEISGAILKRLKYLENSPSQLYILARDQAFFKIQFFAGDRAGDLGRTKTSEILSFPRNTGLLFNHTLTKSLRDGTSNMFALKRYKDPSVCPVNAMEVYVRMCDLLGVPIRQGFLFRPTSPSGDILMGPFDSSAAQARLSIYAKDSPHIFQHRRVTIHGLRSGCAISLALAGAEMNSIMGHVGWKTVSTAEHYIKLQQVMAPNGASDILACLPQELCDVYHTQNTLRGFSQAFS